MAQLVCFSKRARGVRDLRRVCLAVSLRNSGIKAGATFLIISSPVRNWLTWTLIPGHAERAWESLFNEFHFSGLLNCLETRSPSSETNQLQSEMEFLVFMEGRDSNRASGPLVISRVVILGNL